MEFKENVEAELSQIRDMLIKKNELYGNSALEPLRIFSNASSEEQIRVRLDDKISRIKNGADDEDPILDLMGYLVLLKIKQKEIDNK